MNLEDEITQGGTSEPKFKWVPNEDCSKPLGTGKGSFVEALLSCPKLADGETLDVPRDSTDFDRNIAL